MADVDPSPGAGDRRLHDHPVLGPLPPATPATLTVDRWPVPARAGEPVAVALLAAGVRVFRTMPRFGEPRGAYCLVGRCSDCLMVVDGVVNVRTCVTPVRDGMRVETQHGLGARGAAAAAGPDGPDLGPGGGDET